MMDNTPARSDEGSDRLSRRTLIASAAWAAPVVALTIATPLAAASVTPVRNLQASSRVSVPPLGSPPWNSSESGVGKMLVPYVPVVLGLSFTNLGEPLAAGEAFLQGLLTSVAKNQAGQDLFTLTAVDNNNWTYIGKGTPQHAAPTVDAAYPIWFQYQLPLATGQTSSTVYFTATPTGAVADRIFVNGTLQIPGQILYSRAYVNANLAAIPAGTSGSVPYDYRAGWSRVPLPNVTDHFYVEPASA